MPLAQRRTSATNGEARVASTVPVRLKTGLALAISCYVSRCQLLAVKGSDCDEGRKAEMRWNSPFLEARAIFCASITPAFWKDGSLAASGLSAGAPHDRLFRVVRLYADVSSLSRLDSICRARVFSFVKQNSPPRFFQRLQRMRRSEQVDYCSFALPAQ